MYASTQVEAFELFNSVFEIFEKDILAQSPRKFSLEIIIVAMFRQAPKKNLSPLKTC